MSRLVSMAWRTRCLVCGGFALRPAGVLEGLWIQEYPDGTCELLAVIPRFDASESLCIKCWRWGLLWEVGRRDQADREAPLERIPSLPFSLRHAP